MKRGYVHVWGRVKMCGFYGYAFWNLKVYKRKNGKKPPELLVCDGFLYILLVCGGVSYGLLVGDSFLYILLVCGDFLCILWVCDGFLFILSLLKLFFVCKSGYVYVWGASKNMWDFRVFFCKSKSIQAKKIEKVTQNRLFTTTFEFRFFI